MNRRYGLDGDAARFADAVLDLRLLVDLEMCGFVDMGNIIDCTPKSDTYQRSLLVATRVAEEVGRWEHQGNDRCGSLLKGCVFEIGFAQMAKHRVQEEKAAEDERSEYQNEGAYIALLP